MCARRADRLDAVAAEIAAAGGEALPIVADVTCGDEMQKLVDRAVDRFGRLDVMMCNAGFGIAGAIDDVAGADASSWTSTTGDYHATRAALPIFRGSRPAMISCRRSSASEGSLQGAYAATEVRAGRTRSCGCLRAEVAGSGIHVTTVYPVSTETEFFDVMSRETGTAVTRAFGPRQSVEAVADAITRAIEHPVPELYPYGRARVLVWLNAVAPGICDRVVKRFGRKPVR